MDCQLIALSVGVPREYSWNGNKQASGIGKKTVNEVLLTKNGFHGDMVADKKNHGGMERAVCLYPYEHYARWEKEFSVQLKPPAFGENICAAGMLEEDVYIGDIFQIGEAVVQVTQGRVPCATVSKFNGVDPLLIRLFQTCYTGCFFKVIEEGVIKDTSSIVLLERKQEKINVLQATNVMLHGRKNKAALKEVLAVKELAEAWQITFSESLEK